MSTIRTSFAKAAEPDSSIAKLSAGFHAHWASVRDARLAGLAVTDYAEAEDAEFDRYVESNRRRLDAKRRESEKKRALENRRREMITDRLRAAGIDTGAPENAWHGVKLPRYAIVWGAQTPRHVHVEQEPVIESVCRHALDAYLRTDAECVLTIDHDESKVIARRSDGTLQLSADAIGLRAMFCLPIAGGTAAQCEARDRILRGELRGMSWTAVGEQSQYDVRREANATYASVTRMQLSEVCLCDNPAYTQTIA